MKNHSLILPFQHKTPQIAPSVFVAPSSVVIGDVVIGDDSSVWFQTVIRGDVHSIKIGARTNIQDQSMLHVTSGKWALSIGDDVTVGHRVILHGCTVEDRCLIGMGAIVMDGAVIEADSIIGAGALVTPGTRIPAGHLAVGQPARVKRLLSSEERVSISESAQHYAVLAKKYKDSHDQSH